MFYLASKFAMACLRYKLALICSCGVQVEWVLLGHTNLPQPNSKADWQEWKHRYDEALDSIAVMPQDCGLIIFKYKV